MGRELGWTALVWHRQKEKLGIVEGPGKEEGYWTVRFGLPNNKQSIEDCKEIRLVYLTKIGRENMHLSPKEALKNNLHWVVLSLCRQSDIDHRKIEKLETTLQNLRRTLRQMCESI